MIYWGFSIRMPMVWSIAKIPNLQQAVLPVVWPPQYTGIPNHCKWWLEQSLRAFSVEVIGSQKLSCLSLSLFVTSLLHLIPSTKPLHWLRISERIEYKLLSLTYKALPLLNLLICTAWSLFSPLVHTRSSSVVTLSRPPTSTTYTYHPHGLAAFSDLLCSTVFHF